MKAGIITIGDELLIGQVADTNSTWLSARLDEAGIRVIRRVTVGDSRDEIARALDLMAEACDLTVITGGLGPTKDDITKTTLAGYFGCRMVEDADTVAHLGRWLAMRGIEFNTLNRSQAMVPECCTVIRNDNGTAPGMWFDTGDKVIVSLPGVPFEMKALVDNRILPLVKARFGLSDTTHMTVNTYGIPESELAMCIAPWEEALPPYLKLAYLPSPSKVRLRLSAYETGDNAVRDEIERQFAALRDIIPDNILPAGDDTMQQTVGRILTAAGKTVAVAESCTGGAIAASFTANPGASAYFRGGVVAYSNSVKMSALGVSSQTLETYGAVSQQTVSEMAIGVMRSLGADYGIATSGIAGPEGGSPGKPVGTVWIAIAGDFGVRTALRSFGRLRQQNIERAVAAAVDMLRRELMAEGI